MKKTRDWEEIFQVTANEIISKNKWDIIVIQQASSISGEIGSIANVNEYIDLVRSICPNKNIQFFWQMTWPYPTFNDFEIYQNDFERIPARMYQGIVNNVKKYIVNNNNISKIIPSGTAIYNVLQVIDERSVYRDVVHLSFHIGRYITGLTFMKSVFGVNIVDMNKRPFSIMPKTIKYCKEAVNKAIEKPFERTIIKKEE